MESNEGATEADELEDGHCQDRSPREGVESAGFVPSTINSRHPPEDEDSLTLAPEASNDKIVVAKDETSSVAMMPMRLEPTMETVKAECLLPIDAPVKKGAVTGPRTSLEQAIDGPSRSQRKTWAKDEPMPNDFSPGPYDIICRNRGKQAAVHSGNRRFNVVIALNLDRYRKAATKLEKSSVVHRVVNSIREAGGHFVRQDRLTEKWFEIGDQHAREKVGYALRDRINAASSLKKKAPFGGTDWGMPS